ncbi:hypothetical protein SELMODRAFT_116808 [Selaginella moellendorffii]|uniref:WPP domain-containing protein n=1 Tax=Selaginella moellendorffii TaxID=88036 RepID=D8SGM2_SELML|nr:RAN GTPase-activating protein 2 [Selaginella moellendorffii]EFJ16377.1 hypothetical protein SELMODRAFT_116808 [Selaginella moellendorffii]|eukprot:XP_002982624.1 RAN GTPase-activating protein 2 [Selaginella moellendorffii]
MAAASVVADWPPKRDATAQLVATNLTSLAFFWKAPIDGDAKELGSRIEESAFQVASSGDGGDPVAAVKIYAREASRMMLEALGFAMAGTVKDEQCFDISAGQRAFLTKELAEELLLPLETSRYSRICFSNKSFGRDAAVVAGRFLSKVKSSLQDVDFSDIVAGRPEDEALEVMRTLALALEGSKLRSLNLSDNALGEKGVRAFAPLLKSQESLEELSFMNNGISKEAARAICDIVTTGSSLKLLHFHNNMTGDQGARSLAKLVEKAIQLENFRFSSTRVGEEGAVALASAIAGGSKLKVLDLRDNMYGPGGGVALGKALRQHGGLTHVYLSDLSLEDAGSTPVLEALASGTRSIKVLEFGNNEITQSSAKALAAFIAANKELAKLNLSENELGDKGAVMVSAAVKASCSKLEELDLSSNSLSRVGALAAAEAVAGKPGFKLLGIDGNRISSFGLDEVRSVLKSGVGISVLGPLEDNDEEAGGDEEDGNEDGEDGLEEELKGLSLK